MLISGGPAPTQVIAKSKSKIKTLLRELSDNEDVSNNDSLIPVDPQRPWYQQFHAYLDIKEQVPDGMSTISWWGVSMVIQILHHFLIEILSTITTDMALCGLQLQKTIWPLCHPQFQVNAHSHKVELPFQSVAVP